MSAPEAAAAWWAKAIGDPAFDNGGDGFASVLASMVAEHHPVSDEAGSKFATSLALRIRTELDHRRNQRVTVGVDYGPDPILADAAKDAGIASSRFPWKTMMSVRNDHVTVSAGYRAPTVLVWASDEWLADRPACDTQKWDESRPYSEDYNGEPFACSLPKYHDGACQYDAPIDLCVTCGRRDGWYHRADERGHMPDFHAFVAPAVTA